MSQGERVGGLASCTTTRDTDAGAHSWLPMLLELLLLYFLPHLLAVHRHKRAPFFQNQCRCTYNRFSERLPASSQILHAGAQVTPGGSVNSGAAFAWEALVHSDNHRCADRRLSAYCYLVFHVAPVYLHLPLCYERLF